MILMELVHRNYFMKSEKSARFYWKYTHTFLLYDFRWRTDQSWWILRNWPSDWISLLYQGWWRCQEWFLQPPQLLWSCEYYALSFCRSKMILDRINCFVTCSWHQKTKPRILQFTNLKCCIKAKVPFKTPF